MIKLNLVFVIIFLFLGVDILGQSRKVTNEKFHLTASVYEKWPSVIPYVSITGDGKFACYDVNNLMAGKRTTIFQSTFGNWQIKLSNVVSVEFTKNDKYGIFLTGEDSLGIIQLESKLIKYIPKVKSFNIQNLEKGEWIAYHLLSNKLVLLSLKTQVNYQIDSVEQFSFFNDSRILYQRKGDKNKKVMEVLNLRDGKKNEIWSGGKCSRFILDKNKNTVSFLEFDNIMPEYSRKIWMFKSDMEQAILCNIDNSIDSSLGCYVSEINEFSDDGNYLFFSIRKKTNSSFENAVNPHVTIWKYNDSILQSQKAIEFKGENAKFICVLVVKTHDIIRLQKYEDEYISTSVKGEFVTAERNNESNWAKIPHRNYYCVSINSGKRLEFKYPFQLSPDGAFIVYYNPFEKSFFSYHFHDSIERNITLNTNTDWLAYFGRVEDSLVCRGVAGWIPEMGDVLLYDRFDIWRVSLKNEHKPINITNGYGAKNGIIFSFSEGFYESDIVKDREELILVAYDIKNKQNGFFKINNKTINNPERLNMGPYIYEIPRNPYLLSGSSFPIVRSKDNHTFIVRRMSTKESPNFFYSKDLKEFHQLSNVYPEKNYNWVNSELHTWTSLDGMKLDGVLFKPDNFNPNKKYPVIFNIYERRSDWANLYFNPNYLTSGGEINIPMYVNMGYLIFCPDIYYQIGNPMKGCYDAIVSAFHHISKLPYVDENKIGLQGFSFGGFETNYLVTHCDLFSAACSGAGIGNIVSLYNSINYETGESLQSLVEAGQIRMGNNLWRNKDSYLENSPVMNADKVTTPLLLMHASKDGSCLFNNELEFYLSLRRNSKKCWMLEYKNGYHGVLKQDSKDFSNRMAEFFNYYLKDEPMPEWMK